MYLILMFLTHSMRVYVRMRSSKFSLTNGALSTNYLGIIKFSHAKGFEFNPRAPPKGRITRALKNGGNLAVIPPACREWVGSKLSLYIVYITVCMCLQRSVFIKTCLASTVRCIVEI